MDFTDTNLYTCVEGNTEIKVSVIRTQQAAPARDKHTNHGATTPPTIPIMLVPQAGTQSPQILCQVQ